jgi:hypothetical protein
VKRAPSRFELGALEREAARQAEQLEIVSTRAHVDNEKGPQSGPAGLQRIAGSANRHLIP